MSRIRPNKSREVQRFRRVALQRYEDAQLLYRGERNTGAIYLAGYAVECSLKALLLSSMTASECPAAIDSFRGLDGHNLEMLKARYTKRSQVNFPKAITGYFVYVNNWTTSLRYDPSNASPREAKLFLSSTEQIIDRMEGRI
jgi:hypothetical protein